MEDFMQVTELFKLQKHSVYLVRTEVINYYICIPENSYQKTNISIEIKQKWVIIIWMKMMKLGF